MKILQINAVYGRGSTGIIVSELEKLCEQEGLECYVASQDINVCNSKRGYHIGNKFDYKLHALLCRVAGKQAYFSRCATKKLLKFIDSISPDIVHLHILHNNYIYLNLLLRYLSKKNIKTVVTLHDCWYYTGGCFHYTSVKCDKWRDSCGDCVKQRQDTPAYLYDASTQILRDRVKYFSAISDLTFVGCSKWVTAEFSKSLLKDCGQIMCIHNGFDLNIFKPRMSNLKEILDLQDKFVVLGPASKWLQSINHKELEYFSEHLPNDCVLLLFGCESSNFEMSSNVRCYGFIHDRDELAKLYSMADVMVNCSREDTLSSLNLEAQACGTPVITYDATGSKETVDGICGFAVETGNYQQLFENVMNIREKGKDNFSIQCRDFIFREFEKNTNYRKYLTLYKKIVNERA